MTVYHNTRKKGMKKGANGKFYYPKSKGKVARRSKVLNQPFPNITKRVLPYAFRDQLQPPATSTGGFSVASVAYKINSPWDIDPGLQATTSARVNHQPMGYDQLGALYEKQRVDWAKLSINFAVNGEHQAISEVIAPGNSGTETVTGFHTTMGPIRVALLVTDDPALDPSLLVTVSGTVSFEKLIEQSRSGQLPNGTSLKFKTLMPGKMCNITTGLNFAKFLKRSAATTYPDFVENNTQAFNSIPQQLVYCHIIAAPISVNPGDTHPKVTFYGSMSQGMTFSSLRQFGQS